MRLCPGKRLPKSQSQLRLIHVFFKLLLIKSVYFHFFVSEITQRYDVRKILNIQGTNYIKINELNRYSKIETSVCVFSSDLFKLESEVILRVHDTPPVGIILTSDMQMTALTAYTEGKLQVLIDKITKERAKKGLAISCWETKCMLFSKRTCPRGGQRTECVKNKNRHKLKSLGSVLTESAKHGNEIRSALE